MIHERSPQINEIPIVDDNNNQMPATAVSRPIPSSETSSIRRHVRESSLAIPTIGSILKSNRESMNEKSNRITIHEERKISTEEDATPISIPDISEQEVSFLIFSLSPSVTHTSSCSWRKLLVYRQ